jgi:hypothetical protein
LNIGVALFGVETGQQQQFGLLGAEDGPSEDAPVRSLIAAALGNGPATFAIAAQLFQYGGFLSPAVIW